MQRGAGQSVLSVTCRAVRHPFRHCDCRLTAVSLPSLAHHSLGVTSVAAAV